MRNIIVTEYLTLDGVFFEEPGHWSFDYFGEEAMQYKGLKCASVSPGAK